MVLRLDAAEVVFDQLVMFLRATLRTVGGLGLVVGTAVGAALLIALVELLARPVSTAQDDPS